MRIVLALAIAAGTATPARAEGETGPMFGVGIVGTRASEDIHVSGFSAELVYWYGRIGIAADVSRQWSVEGIAGPQVGTAAASVRVLALDHVMPSLLDRREVVELGIELHGVVERAWWADIRSERDPYSYGAGIALRLRGTSDDDRSNLLAESRLFVRVMTAYEWRDPGSDSTDIPPGVLTRDLSPGEERRSVVIMFGLGALWGGGEPTYVETLRRRAALDTEWLVR